LLGNNKNIGFLKNGVKNEKIILFITLFLGMYISILSSPVWKQKPLIDIKASCITNDGSYLYIGTEGDGVFISTDFGANWTKKINGLSDTYGSYVLKLQTIVIKFL
jgi:hypothetical protein